MRQDIAKLHHLHFINSLEVFLSVPLGHISRLTSGGKNGKTHPLPEYFKSNMED